MGGCYSYSLGVCHDKLSFFDKIYIATTGWIPKIGWAYPYEICQLFFSFVSGDGMMYRFSEIIWLSVTDFLVCRSLCELCSSRRFSAVFGRFFRSPQVLLIVFPFEVSYY